VNNEAITQSPYKSGRSQPNATKVTVTHSSADMDPVEASCKLFYFGPSIVTARACPFRCRLTAAGTMLDEPCSRTTPTLIDATQLAVRAASNRLANPTLSGRLLAV